MEKEIVKIRTHKGRIITLTISKRTDTQIIGSDKYNQPVILDITEIASMLPITEVKKYE